MKAVDWIIHMVIDSDGPGGIRNSHTHGMERYNHLDFQMVLPLSQEQTMQLLNTIGREVQSGKRFQPGQYSGEVFSCDFRLELHRETGRDVLRLIFPDPQMRFPEDSLCETPYKYQTVKAFEDDFSLFSAFGENGIM